MPPYTHPNARKAPSKPPPWKRPFSNSTTSNPSPAATTTPHSSQSTTAARLARFNASPLPKDPLEIPGLPSKGDTLLLNHAAQESYYTLLTSRYMDWCAATGNPAVADTTFEPDLDLSASLADMSLDGSSFYAGASTGGEAGKAGREVRSTESVKDVKEDRELSTLHMSMRKLREALLASSRVDIFAQQVYIFIIRASLLSRTFESYHPALLHLLYVLHPKLGLSSAMVHEFVAYQILDTACRLGDYGEAYALRARWGFVDARVDGVLKALVRDDWVGFWRVRRELDGYQRRVVVWAEEAVRRHVFKCVGRGYLSVERGFVERAVGCEGQEEWREVVERNGVGWEVEGDVLVVRRLKKKV